MQGRGEQARRIHRLQYVVADGSEETRATGWQPRLPGCFGDALFQRFGVAQRPPTRL
jgi:hypothetical protein